ncbi:MAG: carbohydrate binding family 9 domain-containing protein [Acidobacteria bacterium]|nr:carbohydrate binding family 9 domain-containing protein [Acidobacteriota bacterium]
MRNLGGWALLFLFASSLSLAQEATTESRQHGKKSLNLMKVEQGPKLDGVLDDKAWQNADVAANFLQKDPSEGAPATEKTEVRMLYDGGNLYFGIECYDSSPDGILGRELRRDNDFANDDSFSIIIDTFHDHRNAFLFRINPRGTQYDALITEEGRDINVSWDEKWDVETRINETGWSAEIRLPVKSIRFSASGENPTFGIDFERIIRRKNEFSYWNNYSRDFSFNQISQAGHLRGIGDMRAGLRLRVKPYINTRIVTQGARQRNTNYLGDIGLEDIKYPITSGLTVDLTINTDFAQTEVDDQVINFDRVPVFFPEKREFFLEGAGIFEFGSLQGEASPEVRLYHSRRIGLSDSGQAIPMLAGAKLTGKLADRWTLGMVEAQTGDYQDKPGDNFAVFRLKRDLLARSLAGVFFTNRQAEDGDYNRVAGTDTNLVFLEHLKFTSLLAKSFTDGIDDQQWLGGAGIQWQDDLINASFNYHAIERNFNSDLGFLKRVGVRRYEPRFSISPRPNSKLIRQISFEVRMEHIRRLSDNSLETEIYHLPQRVMFHNGSSIRFSPHHTIENFQRPFRLPGGLVVPPGRYSWWYYPVTYGLNPALKFTGNFEYRFEKDYYGKGGGRHRWNIRPVVKFSRRFSTEVAYEINRITLPGGPPVTFHQMNNRINYAFSRKWLTSTLVQYSTTGDLLGVNFRLNYIYRPGDNLFVVFNNFATDLGPDRQLDRSLVVKFTHSFDF